MKKIYSLIALVAMFVAAVSVNAQKYHLVQQATDFQVGVTYALYCPAAVAKDANPYANSTTGMGLSLADDSYLWKIEETGEKSEDGYDLYVIYSVDRGAYWQEIDFEHNLGLDGYDVFGYAGINTTFGEKATAARVVILQAGSVEGSRGVASMNDGFVISRNKEVQQEDGSYYYYNLSFQGSDLAFTPWDSERYSWQFWTVEENGPKEKLQELVDLINESGVEYKTGDDPGMYDPTSVEAYDAALNAAIEGLVEPTTTDEQFTQLYADLAAAKEAVDAACNPIKPGYYYFVSGMSAFYAQQGVEKGLYASSATVPMWKDFVLDNILANKDYTFVWQVEETGEQNSGGLDLYYLKNVVFGTVYNGPNSDGYSQQCYLAENGTRKVYFENLGQSQWQVKDNFSNKGLHACDHGGGSGKGSKIVTWNTDADNASAWYLRTVDPEVVEAAYAYAAQIKLIESVDPIVKEANALYDKLFVVAADYTQPLITEADDTKAPGEEGCQFFSNCKEAVEGRYAALIDGNIRATYKQDDSGNWYDSGTATNYGPDGLQAYFHSKYSSFAWPDAHQGKTPYLAVDISKTPVSEFVLRTARRFNAQTTDTTMADVLSQPIQIAIYASNDTTGYNNATDEWTKITTINPYTVPGGVYYVSSMIELGKQYKYIRFDMEKMSGNTAYFCYSEFNLYPGTISQELSQYYYVEGMKDAADAMKAQINAAHKAVDEGTVTEQTITDLQASLDAVKALYADASDLLQTISDAEKLVRKATVGDNFGNIKSDESVAAVLEAIRAAKEVDTEGVLDKAAIDKAIKDVDDAKNAMLNDMVKPEPGKWYFIVNNYKGDNNDAYCLDGTMYVNIAGNTANVTWLPNTERTLDGNATAYWQFIPVLGAPKPNVYYIQNMATGLYMGNQSANARSVTTKISNDPIPFEVGFDGGDNVILVSQKDNDQEIGLHCAAAGKAIVGWYTDAGASKWTFEEVEVPEGVVVPVFEGTRVQTLPFAVEGLADINDGIQFYAVKDMIKAPADGTEGVENTTVELYEKDTFAAGEPFVIVVDEGVTDMVVATPTPDAIVDEPGTSNGLVGALNITPVPVGKAYFANTAATEEEGAKVELKVISESVNIAPLKGYVDPAYFVAPVDAITALSFVAEGLDWGEDAVPGDVDGNGTVNSADVVAIYNFILGGEEETGIAKDVADVDGNGDVNSADVVAVYNIIIGGGSESKAFAKSGSFFPEANITGSDNVLTVHVGNSDDKAKIPVSVYLANPTTSITSVEVNLKAPIAPTNFGEYDEDEGDYIFETADKDRFTSSHTATIAAGTKENPDALFISITSSKTTNLKGTEGKVITVFLNGSELAAGTYTIDMVGNLAIWSDKKTTEIYESEDTSDTFTIGEDGKVTAVRGIAAEKAAKAKGIFTVDGKKVSAPQKGQIYVKDGKTVKF